MGYTEEQIEFASNLCSCNAQEHPKSEVGFWFEGIYIVSIFLDKTGQKHLTFDESIDYYGRDNIDHFMRMVHEPAVENQ